MNDIMFTGKYFSHDKESRQEFKQLVKKRNDSTIAALARTRRKESTLLKSCSEKLVSAVLKHRERKRNKKKVNPKLKRGNKVLEYY